MQYIEGSENVITDILLHLYSNVSPGTQQSWSEFTYHDVVDDDMSFVVSDGDVFPVLAGIEAHVATRWGSCVRQLTEKAAVLAMPFPAKKPSL